MSIAPTGALPAAPAATRGPATAQTAATKAATQFERVLLEQLTKQLAATAAPEGDDASAATSAYRDMLPGTMADALSQAGGIGIAAQLTRSMTAAVPTTAGARAAAAPLAATPTPSVS